MTIPEQAKAIAQTAKFDGVSVHVTATENSRLAVTVEAKGSIDLPGDLDKTVANLLGLLGLGNSSPA
jgi:hypothetical protein